MKRSNNKKLFKEWPEITIGGVLLLFGFSLCLVKVNGDTIGLFWGIGSFILGGASLFIFGAVKHCIERRKGHNLLDNTIEKWKNASSRASLNIRRSQRITFDMSLYQHEGTTYLLVKSKHEYSYVYGSCYADHIIIDTFNDMTIPSNLNNRLPEEKKTQFIEVTVAKSGEEKDTYHHNDPRHSNKFGVDEYGRPTFKMNSNEIKLQKKQRVDICFEINNTHTLTSKHSWYFEQISDELILRINNETGLPTDGFTLIINHPERERIESDNKEYLGANGNLKGPFPEIKIPYVILPFQGFVLSWDFQSKNDEPRI